MKLNRILQGNVLDRLKDLPDRSIQCVVTSPPYWGLRDYGTESVIFGGNDECEHDWNIKQKTTKNAHRAGMAKNDKLASENDKKQPDYYISDFGRCLKCNAKMGQLGLEETPEEYVKNMVEVFREVKRVLRNDGTVWLNLGDSYCGGNRKSNPKQSMNGDKETGHEIGYTPSRDMNHDTIKPKDLVGIPWRVAFALQADGWYLRQDII